LRCAHTNWVETISFARKLALSYTRARTHTDTHTETDIHTQRRNRHALRFQQCSFCSLVTTRHTLIHTHTSTHTHTQCERESERERDKQTDRHKHKHTDKHTPNTPHTHHTHTKHTPNTHLGASANLDTVADLGMSVEVVTLSCTCVCVCVCVCVCRNAVSGYLSHLSPILIYFCFFLPHMKPVLCTHTCALNINAWVINSTSTHMKHNT
jgi:hypothetical protein